MAMGANIEQRVAGLGAAQRLIVIVRLFDALCDAYDKLGDKQEPPDAFAPGNP